jgi:catechol 2,3-dioxygenase-like lactoylglutathione lyase family enzyme
MTAVRGGPTIDHVTLRVSDLDAARELFAL